MVGHHLRAGGHGGKDAARERGPALAARVRMHIRRSHARRCKQFWHRPRRRLQRQEILQHGATAHAQARCNGGRYKLPLGRALGWLESA